MATVRIDRPRQELEQEALAWAQTHYPETTREQIEALAHLQRLSAIASEDPRHAVVAEAISSILAHSTRHVNSGTVPERHWYWVQELDRVAGFVKIDSRATKLVATELLEHNAELLASGSWRAIKREGADTHPTIEDFHRTVSRWQKGAWSRKRGPRVKASFRWEEDLGRLMLGAPDEIEIGNLKSALLTMLKKKRILPRQST